MTNRSARSTVSDPGPSRSIRLGVFGWLAVSLFVAAGCGDITSLKQSNPGQIGADDIYQPSNAQLLMNGVLSDFECAYSRVVTASGLLSDELQVAASAIQNFHYDRRTLEPTHAYSGGCGDAQLPGVYTSLSRARASADTVYARMSAWTEDLVPDRERLLGRLAAYGGYALVVLGENMCSAAIDLGPEMRSEELFQEASSRFDAAISHATAVDDATTLDMARLGRARARLNQGDPQGAAEDAAGVPLDFLVETTPAPVDSRLQNIVYVHIAEGFFGTVAPPYRNLTLNDGMDPRVAVTNTGLEGTIGLPIWTPDKYGSATSPIPVAKYAEAQLIIAEARIREGDIPGAADAINAARNSGGRTGMSVFDATGLPEEEVLEQLVEERRREFFLEGRRLWDVRRLDLPLVPAPGEPYVQGGGVYGDQRCFPLPDVERNNNPNIP